MTSFGQRRLGPVSALRRNVVVGIAVAVGVALASLWLRTAYPALGFFAPHDDWLYIRLAGEIGLWLLAAFPALGAGVQHDASLLAQLAGPDGARQWLGPYNQMIMAKGMAYPLFILINKAAGLPLKISEHLIYLGAALLAAVTVARLTRKGWLWPLLFVVLAFSPVQWLAGEARVIREALYQSLCFALFFLAVRYFLDARRSLGAGSVLGLVAGAYWLTREEGVWLFPALAVVALPWLIETLRPRPQLAECRPWTARLKAGLRHVAPPAVACLLVVLAVNSANWVNYGVFRNNDFRAGPFPAAYGALARIKHDQWKRYVVFPRDARQRAYAVSSAARELMPYFEGEYGKAWVAASHSYPKPWGCIGEPASCNDEILSGWLVWALRDAAAAAGHHRSAPAADAFYARLAQEINAACEAGMVPCHSRRGSLLPVWRGHYLGDTLHASGKVLRKLVRLNDGQVGVPASQISAEQARIFALAINSPVSGFDPAAAMELPGSGTLGELRVNLTRKIAGLFTTVSPPLFVLALFSYGFLLVAWIKVKSASVTTYSIVILTGVLAAIFSRVGLLGFLEATSVPSNNLLYLVPVVPFYLFFVAASLALGADAVRSLVRDQHRASA